MTFPKTILSTHAAARLAARSSLSGETLVKMLDRQIGRKIGCTARRSHLAHRLFWSPADEAFLVAIQDVVTGTVLTVLTEPMYERWYPGGITEPHRRRVLAGAAAEGCAPMRFLENRKLHCFVSAKLAGSQHPTLLGRWSSNEVHSIEQLGTSKPFWKWIAKRIRTSALSLDALEAVLAMQPDGELAQIHYACWTAL